MATITHGASVIAPTTVLDVSAERESNNVTHKVLGREELDVTLRAGSLGNGTLQLGFLGATSETDSKTAFDLFATGKVFTLTNGDRTSLDFSFVVTGFVKRLIEDETRDAWILEIEYQVVTG